MADPILESSLKTRLNTMCCNIFLLLNKKVEKFQLCLKTAASLFPLSCLTFPIGMFHLAITLFVYRNWWLIYLVKFDYYYSESNVHQNFPRILRIPSICFIFCQNNWLLNSYQCCHFSLNKSWKAYLGTMLPSRCRDWQLIYPNWFKNKLQHTLQFEGKAQQVD